MSQDSDPFSPTSPEAREAYIAELKKTIKDKHHLLWCRSEWSQGSAKCLRQNKYLGVQILLDFHHDVIHHELRNVPVPAEHLCLAALSRIQSGLISGELDPVKDPPYFRLGLLIDLWEIQAKDTTAVLLEQQELFKDYHDDVIDPLPNLVVAAPTLELPNPVATVPLDSMAPAVAFGAVPLEPAPVCCTL